MLAVPIGDDWGRPFEERFGLRLVQAFGMTECNIPAYGKLEGSWLDVRVVSKTIFSR